MTVKTVNPFSWSALISPVTVDRAIPIFYQQTNIVAYVCIYIRRNGRIIMLYYYV